MCLVVTARPYIQPPMRLIGLWRVRWAEGEGGAWREIAEKKKKEGESKRKRSVHGRGLMGCKGCRGRPGKWEGC